MSGGVRVLCVCVREDRREGGGEETRDAGPEGVEGCGRPQPPRPRAPRVSLEPRLAVSRLPRKPSPFPTRTHRRGSEKGVGTAEGGGKAGAVKGFSGPPALK